jgi:hypothetical protein
MYFSVPAEFDNQTEKMSVAFIDKNSGTELFLDTRSIGKEQGFKTIVFGPQSFVFLPGSPDLSYVYKQWNLTFDICGGNIIIL